MQIGATLSLLGMGILAGAGTAAAEKDVDRRIDRALEETRGEEREEDGVLLTAGTRVLDRTRRSLTLGPFVGVAPAIGTENDGELAFDVEAGLALLRYDIPVIPTASRLKEIALGAVRERLRERVAAAIDRGDEPSDEEIEAWARELHRRLLDELLLKHRPRTFEKPSFQARLTVDRLFGEDAWNLRAGVGVGLGPVYLSAGGGASVNRPVQGLGYLEVSVPILVTEGLRSPALEPFVRFDAFTGEDDGRSDQLLIGGRFVLDIL